MYHGGVRDEIERFVESLSIPADRKTVVLAELLDHAASAREAAVRDGRDPEAAERAALGELEKLRGSLERVEPAFRITRRQAVARGAMGGLLVAVMADQGGPLLAGALGALATIAIAIVFAPPRFFDLLHAEMRAPKVRGVVLSGVPIGPAASYCYAALSTPYLIWITLIVIRVLGGATSIDVPPVAITPMLGAYALMLYVGVRSIRRRIAR